MGFWDSPFAPEIVLQDREKTSLRNKIFSRKYFPKDKEFCYQDFDISRQ